jgi:hypothetical protein
MILLDITLQLPIKEIKKININLNYLIILEKIMLI